MRAVQRTPLVGLLLVLGLVVAAQPSSADGVGTLPPISDQERAESVVDLKPSVIDLDLGVAADVASTERDDGETVVTLTADILFAFGKADLPPAAKKKIGELARKAPRSARMTVDGHTDSVGTAGSNTKLSQRRADAVAKVIRATRPDLKLTVKGFGETRPLEPNRLGGEDNPEGRAKNRRVELRYHG